MFQIGDFVIYGGTGVCKVEKIESMDFPNAENGKLYYTLAPVYRTETIYTPVETEVFLRPIITCDEANRLIDTIPEIRENIFHNHSIGELTQHYKSAFQTHTCEDLLQLVKNVYAKNQNMLKKGKKLGMIDQRYMKRAKELLHGELAVALDISYDSVEKYIENRLLLLEETEASHN